MNAKKLTGLVIAAGVAGAFALASAPAMATGNGKTVHCYGVNSCKGKGSCKTANNACKGLNSCKGKGIIDMSKAECKKQGGTIVK